MKIYAPNTKKDGIGGGFTFYRNFVKGMRNRVHFVDRWEDCDIVFITGITIVEPHEIVQAKQAGKKIVLRVDNVPRKSRNKRNTPHQRLREVAELSDIVVYQSEWAKTYCYPLCGEGTVIYNGVDLDIFKPNEEIQKKDRYLFAYHGKNEQKNFWEAHLRFQYIARNNPSAEFWFIYDFGSDMDSLREANFDFWNGERFRHIPKIDEPEDMAILMQQCKYLIYPAISDASPNVVSEARACGCDVIYPAAKELSGTQEVIQILDLSLERMCDEYYGVFDLALNDQSLNVI